MNGVIPGLDSGLEVGVGHIVGQGHNGSALLVADLGALHAVQGLQCLLHGGLAVAAHHAFNVNRLFHGSSLRLGGFIFRGRLHGAAAGGAGDLGRRRADRGSALRRGIVGGAARVKVFSRRAFVTTQTLDRLMAAEAIIGFSVMPKPVNTPAASGMQMAL